MIKGARIECLIGLVKVDILEDLEDLEDLEGIFLERLNKNKMENEKSNLKPKSE